MALTSSSNVDQAFKAINFELKGVDEKIYSFNDIKGEKGTLIMFICNHCPYVIAVMDRLVNYCKTMQNFGIGCVAIMPNDTETYPADSFENMKLFAEKYDFNFPYLIDESQDIAKSYDAVCTPDIFGFNKEGLLQYRGRVDSAGKNQADADTIQELVHAMKTIAKTDLGPEIQHPSMGCSIKWRN